jgi:23S rRNA pseudouridine1911/1915/1917 synthase
VTERSPSSRSATDRTDPTITDRLELAVPDALAGSRVDRAVALLSGLPRRVVADLVAAGRVRLDGGPVDSRHQSVRRGQVLSVDLPIGSPLGPTPDPTVPFTVVHEDDDLVVVDKPAGVVVHHGAGHAGGTLVDGLVARYPDLVTPGPSWADPTRPGIVHRLDKTTSGLLVVARTPDVQRALVRQLRERRAGREYLTLVTGIVDADNGVIEAPIGRSSRQPTRMVLTPGGRPARTHYHVRARYTGPEPTSYLDVRLETGRTHQIRVHAAAIGHPVVGDARYGDDVARRGAVAAMLGPERLFLHATRLTVDHPQGGRMTWQSPLPPDLAGVLDRLAR